MSSFGPKRCSKALQIKQRNSDHKFEIAMVEIKISQTVDKIFQKGLARDRVAQVQRLPQKMAQSVFSSFKPVRSGSISTVGEKTGSRLQVNGLRISDPHDAKEPVSLSAVNGIAAPAQKSTSAGFSVIEGTAKRKRLSEQLLEESNSNPAAKRLKNSQLFETVNQARALVPAVEVSSFAA